MYVFLIKNMSQRIHSKYKLFFYASKYKSNHNLVNPFMMKKWKTSSCRKRRIADNSCEFSDSRFQLNSSSNKRRVASQGIFDIPEISIH